MTRRVWCWMACAALLAPRAFAQSADDPGKQTLGAVTVRVIHATNGEPTKGEELSAATLKRLRNEPRLKFTNYREIGSDTKPLFRSYENWAQPLGSSDEVLVRFEVQSKPSGESMRLGLELWLSRKKILKTEAEVTPDRPLYVLGPEWRGGRLIISIGLAPKSKSKSQ